MYQTKSALKPTVCCPVCGQGFFTLSMGKFWHRGNTAVCSECIADRAPEARAWIDGFDEALKWKDGKVK